ncbi:hypothetical protein WYY_16287 [Bacillus velezensis M27]|nr:hypothetical protein B938_03155 [Bacillus velezensis AS43.3]AHK48259.1 hypothetical protein AJ82_03810 [Bacillus velezensis TrigoCor1448]AJK64403.1 hypothetical protein KHU1_0434 [Bacillus amyloliquefaciens KHG19]AKF29624.1 hypothetical protein AAV29_03300 [Bacillus velezensis]EJD67635.1 hypothetical protein BB65665_10345 [Bacillus sp. 916]EKE46456.1 hypothetical protein WYY_16287 [Bacillus velezensis M27]KJD58297.1 hypothetical protein UZ38_08560 [Bacillus amyloliquefaciens]
MMIPASGCILFPPSHALFFRKKSPAYIATMRKQYKPGMARVSSVVRFCDIHVSCLSLSCIVRPFTAAG